jgi:D-arabinono-1,4-lactone oxidase/FAD binding domain-containing protein
MTERQSVRWSNWAGNQTAEVSELLRPGSEDELTSSVLDQVKRGRKTGAAGSLHSFSRIVPADDTIIDMTGVSGLIEADRSTQTATVLAGTRLKELGPLLWDAGLGLRNMGDIDKQTIAGAISTATHGSGINYGSLSSVVRGLRVVTGTGEVLDIDTSSPERLRAVQTAIGTLGVITRVTLDVTSRYWLQEDCKVLPVEEVLDSWAAGVATERHWQFFYAPAETSYRLYDLPPFPKDHCWVKVLREVEVADDAPPIAGEHGSRIGRSYLIYPDTADEVATWVEMEYMVDARDAKEAFVALRELILSRFPEVISPIQLRWIRGEEAFLSPMNGRDSVSISVSGELTHDWLGFLAAVDALLHQWGPRPHWGKQYFLDGDRTSEIYPELSRFLTVRDELDPERLFLNDHLAGVFGI